MIASVIGCGPSAKDWGKQKFDLSIGCNDMLKFGYQPDQLVLVNHKGKFSKDRLDTILRTRPKKLWTHTSQWRSHFSDFEIIRFSHFSGYFMKGNIYHCRTSPMVAICLAIRQGATDVVLYGVDMLSHKVYRTGTKEGDNEIKTYLKFFDAVKKKGINIYLGNNGSALEGHIPFYDPYYKPIDFSLIFEIK